MEWFIVTCMLLHILWTVTPQTDALMCIRCEYTTINGELATPPDEQDCLTNPDFESDTCILEDDRFVVRCIKADITIDTNIDGFDLSVVSHARGCAAFPVDEDPGDRKLSTSELQRLFQDDEGVVFGDVHTCSTDNCNGAIAYKFSSVLCILLACVAYMTKLF